MFKISTVKFTICIALLPLLNALSQDPLDILINDLKQDTSTGLVFLYLDSVPKSIIQSVNKSLPFKFRKHDLVKRKGSRILMEKGVKPRIFSLAKKANSYWMLHYFYQWEYESGTDVTEVFKISSSGKIEIAVFIERGLYLDSLRNVTPSNFELAKIIEERKMLARKRGKNRYFLVKRGVRM
jgi:hypothetical protein